MNHKTDMQAALRAALELTRYAAAPFFSKKERKRDADKNVTYIYPTTEEWWDGLREQIESVQPLIEAALAARPDAQTDEPTAWRPGSETPPVKEGKAQEFILAVRRKHAPEKVFVFAANYANNFTDDGSLSGRDGEDFTAHGWYLCGLDTSGEFDEVYEAITLNEGDEILGWQPLPKWQEVPAAAPAPVSEPSPDSEQVGFIEAAVTKLAADFARIGEAFMDLCSELGCPDNTNMLDWARGRMTCDACYGTGRVFVGNSGRESDGNAPEFERCPSCGYGDAAPSRERGERQGEALSAPFNRLPHDAIVAIPIVENWSIALERFEYARRIADAAMRSCEVQLKQRLKIKGY